MVIDNSQLALEDKYLLDDEPYMPDAATTRHILLIEDNRSDVFLIRHALCHLSTEDDFECTDVPRVGDALELLEETDFDLILLDLNLLDSEGVETIAAVHAEVPNTPILVHTADVDPVLRRESLLCGAKHYVVKGSQSPYVLKYMIQDTLTYSQV